MKKMNVYEAPVAEVIEMNLNATVLTGSPDTTGYTGGLDFSRPGFQGITKLDKARCCKDQS